MKNKSLFVFVAFVAMTGFTHAEEATKEKKKGNRPTPGQIEKPGKAKVKKQKKPKQPAEPAVELTEAGQQLLACYSDQLKALQAELEEALPKVGEQQVAAYMKAREAEGAAKAKADEAKAALKSNQSTAGKLLHRMRWIAKAEAGVAAANEKLKQAEAMTADQGGDQGHEKAEALKAAREELAAIQENHCLASSELKKAQDAVAKAETERPPLVKEVESTKAALASAMANSQNAIKDMNIESFLSSDELDARLAKYVVLHEATPRGLAEFAQQGKEQEALIEKLLADGGLMIQMAVAGGAQNSKDGQGKYGEAMKIYTDIQKTSEKAKDGFLQRLALAISLEHAVPIAQTNPKAQTDAPAKVDPVKRYQHYEKAYLNGELDSAFKDLAVWDYRFVVDGADPDEALAWGREMLLNYRPDIATMPDDRWRYVKSVVTEVKYGSQDQKAGKDRPELQNSQNIIANGGVCGRRAFFGRYILRSFGIPTVARPQSGHAALAHWTPEGWVICLGGGWGIGTAQGIKDLDFLANTQARAGGEAYLQVARAKWAGHVLGENRAKGFLSGIPEFWNSVALYRQREIIEEIQAVTLAAVGEDLGEANESEVKEAVTKADIPEADRQIVVSPNGAITVPAVACSNPTNNTPKISFMESRLGGMQLHYNRIGEAEDFEYTFDAPDAGTYALSARVVTTSAEQHLLVAANDAKEPVDIAVPYTVGMWETTQPVEIKLLKGRNVLRFSRGGENIKGLTIKDFTLTPVK